jgi:hypothetical protein
MFQKEKKIIWIENTTNEFYSNIGGIIPTNCKNLKVKLISCYIEYPDANVWNASLIRILCNFNTGHNQKAKYNEYIQLGIINNPLERINECIENNTSDTNPTYSLYSIPELIYLKITNENYVNLFTVTSGLAPTRINLCLKISYHI